MGLLDGGLKAIIGKAVGPILLNAQIYKSARTEQAGGGFSVVSADPVPCRAFLDQCTEAMRETAGYTIEDVSILILQSGVPVTLDSDDQILIRGVRYRVGTPIDQDPAQATWTCRGTPLNGG